MNLVTTTRGKQYLRKSIPPSWVRGTIPYFKRVSWFNLNQRTINGSNPKAYNASYLRKEILLAMSKEEFYSWCDLKSDQILSFYENKKTPSLDRIDNDKHYSLDNIRVIDMRENQARRWENK